MIGGALAPRDWTGRNPQDRMQPAAAAGDCRRAAVDRKEDRVAPHQVGHLDPRCQDSARTSRIRAKATPEPGNESAEPQAAAGASREGLRRM